MHSYLKKCMTTAAVISTAAFALAACQTGTDGDESGANASVNSSAAPEAVSSAPSSTSSAGSAAAGEIAIDENGVGRILDREELDRGAIIAAPNGAKTLRVTYGARNAHGDPIAVTGLVTTPEGAAPEGGWPVLSWAHGTTGLAKECAPSLAIEDHPDDEALAMVATDYLQKWLDKGFAVVQPDYEGLGTVGEGTYMDRASLASSVNDLVRASREEFDFADSWFNAGWSQGGFAAIAAASAEDVPVGLEQTLAIAPGDTQIPGGAAAQDEAMTMIDAIDPKNLAYGAYAVQGAMNFNPDIKADDFLSAEGKKVLEKASTKCLSTFKQENTIPGGEILKDDPDLSALIDHMNDNSMVGMRPATPVRIFISKDDEIINYDIISSSAKMLKENAGTDVEIIERSGESHRDMVRRAFEDQREFVDALR